jgi:predicted dehydrogenase
MNACARECDVVFGIMYNQRPNPLYQKVKDLIDSGELGEIRRSNWIITNWYRSQSYYNSGGWRATWKGEGGGVLLNQDPHQLDLWQWLVGMPVRLRAFCQFGKHRDIEVEDEVTAYAEYANGATGVFITTVAETPGTNRLEIVGDRGKVVVEEGNCATGGYVNPKPPSMPAGKTVLVNPNAGRSPSPSPRNAANITLLPPISLPPFCAASR